MARISTILVWSIEHNEDVVINAADYDAEKHVKLPEYRQAEYQQTLAKQVAEEKEIERRQKEAETARYEKEQACREEYIDVKELEKVLDERLSKSKKAIPRDNGKVIASGTIPRSARWKRERVYVDPYGNSHYFPATREEFGEQLDDGFRQKVEQQFKGSLTPGPGILERIVKRTIARGCEECEKCGGLKRAGNDKCVHCGGTVFI